MKIVVDIPEELYKHIKNDNVYYLEDGEDLYTIVKNGIPYEERPKGKWKEVSDGHGHSSYFCSRCGTQEGKTYNVCPNCKANMRG